MLSYCYSWAPLVVIGTLAVLALPWLGLVALMVLLLGSIALLGLVVSAILWPVLRVSQAIVRWWHGRSRESRQFDTAVPWITPRRQSNRSIPAGMTAFHADPQSRRDG